MDRISGQALRILLVSAREGAREEVAGILDGWSRESRLYWVSQSNLAVARAQDVMPHVVLVDSDLDGADPVHLIRQLTTRVPGSALVALVELNAMARASQAVLAGACAFVVKPMQRDELLATVRQVLSGEAAPGDDAGEAAPTELGEVIVFCAPKGGTGRTTTAVNTAVSLRQSGDAGVALVDADYAAPALDVALNLPAQHSVVDLLPRLARLDRELVASILEEHASGLQVLLAPPPADLDHPIGLPQVEQILVWLKSMFPWVLVDLGLPMDETAFAFLDGADRIVVTVLPEMIGLRNTRLLVDQMHARGYPEERIWLVVNRANMRGGVTVADIEARLRVRVRCTVPDDQPLVTHSVNRGVPVALSHPRSPLARAFADLARDLAASVAAERAPEGDGERVRGGLFGRLFGSSSSATS